ncbi:methyltransferase family protein [Amycolatopsis alkalitolerans]|uniref:Isoprenylcysteine carboxylmethyltransferase family protein n=1 Tax=Amycolatopsis alkalitolerans TaxID=2547244 RepID=A0A5C4M9D7_9PSEU|nr:isoprenylcysteine carboxylmethyltransferase family protein [Amycolatopsis alkalitolerans]TNC29198.1 isoprenylcysteine carboxylmethyltransferase family protein [Amycolatopsis alkalitolerans]
MRRSLAAVVAVGWGVAVGGTFGCLLPYLLGYWTVRWSAPFGLIPIVVGAVLIGLGVVPIVQAFVAFVRAGGTPVPAASPPRLVVSGLYRYVRNPIYVGFLVVLLGEALLFGSVRIVGYTAIAWCVSAAAVLFYEQPRLARRFGTEYERYRHAVPAWLPRLRRLTLPEHAVTSRRVSDR